MSVVGMARLHGETALSRTDRAPALCARSSSNSPNLLGFVAAALLAFLAQPLGLVDGVDHDLKGGADLGRLARFFARGPGGRPADLGAPRLRGLGFLACFLGHCDPPAAPSIGAGGAARQRRTGTAVAPLVSIVRDKREDRQCPRQCKVNCCRIPTASSSAASKSRPSWTASSSAPGCLPASEAGRL